METPSLLFSFLQVSLAFSKLKVITEITAAITISVITYEISKENEKFLS